MQTKGKHATLLNIILGRVDVAVVHRREAQIVTAVIVIVLAAALFSCQSVSSSKSFQPCTASGRIFEYWEPCLPEFFPGCQPCSEKYTIKDMNTVFEAARTEWSMFGKTEPWWSVLTDDRWKGKVDIPNHIKDEFYESEIGEGLINELLRNFSDGKQISRNSALDFGCGVGRTTFGLHQRLGFQRVVGIDQSIWHLQVARQEAKRKGIDGHVEFVVSNPDMLASLQCEKFDFAYSMIALQHMVPPLIVTYIEQMCDSLRVGGRGFFQVPTRLIADYSQVSASKNMRRDFFLVFALILRAFGLMKTK
jgi:SAM-dependent methyltransferase